MSLLISAISSCVASRRMDLSIVTVMHGRHDLTRLWAEYTVGLGLPVFAAFTAGDDTLRSICDQFGIVHIAAPNEPLGAKHNAALDLCGADRVMLVPSDDFIAPAWVDKVRDTQAPYLYPDSCGLLDVKTSRACVLRHHGPGVRKFGAGRVISREVIDRVGTLWSDDKGRGLDTDSHGRIVGAGFQLQEAGIGGVAVVDIKTGDNLWPFDRFCRGSAVKCSADDVIGALSPEFKERILALC